MFLSRVLVFTLIALFITTNKASSQVYQWIDEKGNVVFSNVVPPPEVEILEPKQTDKNDPAVSAYCGFSQKVQQQVSRIEKGIMPTEEDVDGQAEALNKLTEFVRPHLSGEVPPATASRINYLNKTSDYLKEKAQHYRDQGNFEKSLLITDRAQACRSLVLKHVAEDYLGRNNIPYTPIYVSDEACFDVGVPPDEDQTVVMASSEIKRPSESNNPIKADCQKEWNDDYRMVEYCIKTQSQALSNISHMNGQILERCKEEWGGDYRMVEYCTKTQTEAKARVDGL